MTLLLWIIVFCLVGGVLSVLAAALFLLLPLERRTGLLPHMVSFATGALLGAAFLGVLPHALEGVPAARIPGLTFTMLCGILLFFLLEKMVLWRHCHSELCEVHGDRPAEPSAAGVLVLVGDGVHNFVDGVVIAAAFLTDRDLGILTALAVTAHEIPQEMGDFAVLLHSGFGRGRALLFNVLSSLTTVVGGILAYYALVTVQAWLPYILAVAAASLIYIAVADLIPSLHRRTQVRATLEQLVLIMVGVGVIAGFNAWLMH